MVRKRASMLISFRSLMIRQSRGRTEQATATISLSQVVAYSSVGSLEWCRVLGHGDHVSVDIVAIHIVIVFDDTCWYDGNVVRSVL
jgi:hypothetical protein